MATTTLGQTNTFPRSKMVSNKSIYWGIAIVLAILLVFAFTANRTSSIVTPTSESSIETSTAFDSTPTLREMENAPPMDSTPNTVIIPPEVDVAPTDTMMTNEGVFVHPVVPPAKNENIQDPGTSANPEAPKGTVERR